jgi:hypothetical protein
MRQGLAVFFLLGLVAIGGAMDGKPLPTDAKDSKKEVSAWFHVTFNDKEVTLDVAAPGKTAWKKSIPWTSIIRVCFKPEFPTSDGIYIFTRERPESYAIPMEGSGGPQLWDELIRRNLFSADLAIKAASSTEGVLCWPDKK